MNDTQDTDPAVAALAKALHHECTERWKRYAIADPGRQMTMHMDDAHIEEAQDALAALDGWHLVPAATPTSEREEYIRKVHAKHVTVNGEPFRCNGCDLLALLDAARAERDVARTERAYWKDAHSGERDAAKKARAERDECEEASLSYHRAMVKAEAERDALSGLGRAVINAWDAGAIEVTKEPGLAPMDDLRAALKGGSGDA